MNAPRHASGAAWVFRGVFALAVALVLAGGWGYFRAESAKIRREKFELLATIADLKSRQLQNWRAERLTHAQRVIRAPFLREMVTAFLHDPAEPAARTRLLDYLRLQRADNLYANALLFTPDGGQLLLAAMDEATAPMLADDPAYATTAAKQTGQLTNLFPCVDGRVCVDTVGAVLDASGRTQALLVFRTDAASYLYPLLQAWPTPSRTAETLLVSRAREGVVFLTPRRFQATTGGFARETLAHATVPAVGAVMGHVGAFDGADYRGEPVLADLRALPDSPWFMVTKMDREEILAEARYRAGVASVVVAALVALLGFAGAYVYRRRQAGLYRDLYLAEHREVQAQERIRHQAELLRQARDVIIATDTAGRITYWNEAAERLTGHAAAAVLGRPALELLGRDQPAAVAATERELAAHGSWRGETTVVTRTGATRVMDLSMTVLRDQAGQVTGRLDISTDVTERKQAERALAAAAAQLQVLFEHSPVAIWDEDFSAVRAQFDAWRAAGVDDLRAHLTDHPEAVEHCAQLVKVRDLNHAALALLGCATKEEAPRRFADFFTPAALAAFREELLALAAGRTRFETELVARQGREGRVMTLWLNLAVVPGSERTLDRVLLTFQDITARQHAEAALREREEIFRRLFEDAGDPVLLLKAGQFIDCNTATLRLLGHADKAALLPCPPDRLSPARQPDGRASAEKAAEMIATAERAGHHHFEWEHRRADGAPVPVEVTLTAITAGGETLLHVLWRDISQRKRDEQTLRLHSAALAAAADSVVITDASGRIEWVNPAFTATTGYDRAEAVGREQRDLLRSGRHPPEFFRELWTTILSGRAWRGEITNRRKDGTLYPEAQTITPLADAAGRITHFIGIKRDVTEQKSLQEQFLRAQRLEGIGMLAAGIAHDLNNVLMPMLLAAPMLRENATAPEDLRLLASLEQSAERGAALVRQILSFAHGRAEEPKLIQVKHVAKDLVDMIRETLPKQVRIEANFPADNWPIRANPTHLHQILLNLCVNARDAMPAGGTLRLGAANRVLDETAAARLPGARPGPFVVVTVADTGTGIPPGVVERVWEPFFTTKGEGKGTGLGLSTVRGLVAAHQGFIELQTAEGVGTEIRLYFPAAETGWAGEADAPAADALRGRGELILVVDDDQLVRDMATTALAHHGYRVLACADGVEAVGLFTARAAEIALVVTDVDMPNLGGAALGRVLARLNPRVRLLVMSGLSRSDDGGDADGSGFEQQQLARGAFLLKPFKVGALLQAVHRLLHPSPGPGEPPEPVSSPG